MKFREMKKWGVIGFLCLILAGTGFGQNQLGMRLSNYSGVAGMQLNPAHNIASRQTWEAQLGGVSLFGDNNYFFVENTSLLDLWRARNLDASLYERPDLSPGEVPVGEKVFVVDYQEGSRKRYGTGNLNIMGPGFMIKRDDGQTFGLYTGVRGGGGSHQVPKGFSYFPYFGQKFYDSFDVEPFAGAIMLWGEVGFNYGFSIETNVGRIGLGLNAKILAGMEGFYFKSEEQVDFTKLPDLQFTSNIAQLRFGYTSSNLDPYNLSPKFNGYGLGLDLGFTYIVDGYDEAPKWQFGASILDIGSVNFRQNANPQIVSADSLILIDGGAYDFFTGIEDIPAVVKKFSEQALADSLLSSAGSQYRIWTPTALTLSADYSFNDFFFVNAILVQRVPVGDLAVTRDNILAITPRFEHKWFEFSLPVVLLEYNQVQVGVAARVGVITIGSDNIASLMGKSNLSGMDFYFGVKVPGFQAASERGVPSTSKRRKRGKVKCYSF
ncbi:MAG: hypothetical protein KDC34_00825 [Saprospiraceae bacterium]|nr:hypothetical protein [Saprospiraceae bacterium]